MDQFIKMSQKLHIHKINRLIKNHLKLTDNANINFIFVIDPRTSIQPQTISLQTRMVLCSLDLITSCVEKFIFCCMCVWMMRKYRLKIEVVWYVNFMAMRSNLLYVMRSNLLYVMRSNLLVCDEKWLISMWWEFIY